MFLRPCTVNLFKVADQDRGICFAAQTILLILYVLIYLPNIDLCVWLPFTSFKYTALNQTQDSCPKYHMAKYSDQI